MATSKDEFKNRKTIDNRSSLISHFLPILWLFSIHYILLLPLFCPSTSRQLLVILPHTTSLLAMPFPQHHNRVQKHNVWTCMFFPASTLATRKFFVILTNYSRTLLAFFFDTEVILKIPILWLFSQQRQGISRYCDLRIVLTSRRKEIKCLGLSPNYLTRVHIILTDPLVFSASFWAFKNGTVLLLWRSPEYSALWLSSTGLFSGRTGSHGVQEPSAWSHLHWIRIDSRSLLRCGNDRDAEKRAEEELVLQDNDRSGWAFILLKGLGSKHKSCDSVRLLWTWSRLTACISLRYLHSSVLVIVESYYFQAGNVELE